jgi:ABC-type sugar transport system substrate-binding protein
MKRKLILLGALTVLGYFCGAGAHAAMSGAEFLTAQPSYQNGFVDGFVRGMYAACLDHLEAKKDVCSLAPVLDAAFDMTPQQVLDAFLKYIRENGERQQKEASELLIDCLKESIAKPAKPK